MKPLNILILLFVQKCVGFTKLVMDRSGNVSTIVDTEEFAVNALKSGDTDIDTFLLNIESPDDAFFGQTALSAIILAIQKGVKSFVINNPGNKDDDIIKIIKSLKGTIDQDLKITVTDEPLIVVSTDGHNRVLYSELMEPDAKTSIDGYLNMVPMRPEKIQEQIQSGNAVEVSNWLMLEKIAIEHFDILEDSQTDTSSNEKTEENAAGLTENKEEKGDLVASAADSSNKE